WYENCLLEFFDSNGPLAGGKRSLQEGGIRVPMIARWPGKIQPGAVSGHVSAFWDFLPTACEVAGIEPPENINGISYLPELLGQSEEQKQHEYLYWIWAVRVGPWKLYPAGKDRYRLYHLEDDIGEKHDVAAMHPDVVARCSTYFDLAKGRTPGPKKQRVKTIAQPPPPPPGRLPDIRLTRLKPLKAKTGFGRLGIGTSIRGGPLSLSGKIYKDGIGIHANGELIYTRDPAWTHFVARVGIDDIKRNDPRASILCKVMAEDAAGKLHLLAQSSALKSGQHVEHQFDVPLPVDCVRLHLIVNDAGDGIHSDHADWVNAGFIRKSR
ncbi:MAG: NPCBM/NEW2 domain-containing protein, partial [Verrucomicrobiota bacterium]